MLNLEYISRTLAWVEDTIKAYEGYQICIFSSLLHLRFSKENYHQLYEGIMDKCFSHIVLFPTYTYSSRTQTPYDPFTSWHPGCGSLSRTAWEASKHISIRTNDPNYSYVCTNGSEMLSDARKGEFTRFQSKSFGRNSQHAMLFSQPILFFSLGRGLDWGFTPCMHIEACAKVPYRHYVSMLTPVVDQPDRIVEYYMKHDTHACAKVSQERTRMLGIPGLTSSFSPGLDRSSVNVVVDGPKMLQSLLPILIEEPDWFWR